MKQLSKNVTYFDLRNGILYDLPRNKHMSISFMIAMLYYDNVNGMQKY